jgi:hypothetical protein
MAVVLVLGSWFLVLGSWLLGCFLIQGRKACREDAECTERWVRKYSYTENHRECTENHREKKRGPEYLKPVVEALETPGNRRATSILRDAESAEYLNLWFDSRWSMVDSQRQGKSSVHRRQSTANRNYYPKPLVEARLLSACLLYWEDSRSTRNRSLRPSKRPVPKGL